MNTNVELKNHLLYEFSINNTDKFLNETRSVVNGMNEVVMLFLDMVSEQIKKTTNDKTTYIYSEENNIFANSNIKTFFNKFKLELTTVLGKKSYSGDSDINTTIFKNNEDKWVCTPYIRLKIQGENIQEIRNVFGFAIGHELTHIYNMLQYAIKNNKSGYDVVTKKNKYTNIINVIHKPFFEQNPKAIATMLYNLTRVERNAYIAQLKQELSSFDNITDFNSVYNAIKKTESYGKFLYLENSINFLFSKEMNNSKQTKDNIMSYLNSIMKTNFTNFEQVKKYFLRRWNKWKKVYLTKASKIAYDVYLEKYKNNRTIGNNSFEPPLLQIED